MKELYGKGDRGPGVPEAVPRGLQLLWAELGPETLDRVWIFPPLVSGRAERGLLAVSRYAGTEDGDRRVLLTLPYVAERTGAGLTIERSLEEQGEAPLDRFPRVMEGVVQRADSDLGEPVEVVVEGSGDRFLEVLAGFDEELLDPELPPLGRSAPPVPEEESESASPDPVGTGSVLDELDSADEAASGPDDDLYDLYAAGPAS